MKFGKWGKVGQWGEQRVGGSGSEAFRLTLELMKFLP